MEGVFVNDEKHTPNDEDNMSPSSYNDEDVYDSDSNSESLDQSQGSLNNPRSCSLDQYDVEETYIEMHLSDDEQDEKKTEVSSLVTKNKGYGTMGSSASKATIADYENLAKELPNRIHLNAPPQYQGYLDWFKFVCCMFCNWKRKYNQNLITTTQYTWWNFLIKNIIIQCKDLANSYFIIIMCISFIPGISPLIPITAILPVVFILTVNAGRDLITDILRYYDDREANSQVVTIVDPDTGEKRNIKSKHLKPGDIVYCEKDSEIPADILVLSTSNDSPYGYIETKNLDGESNLKPRNVPHVLGELHEGQLHQEEFELQYEKAHKQFSFNGVLTYQGSMMRLNEKHTIYRSSVLKSTDWIYGLVLYTGLSTKLHLNLRKTKSKYSKMQKALNIMLISLVILNQLSVYGITVGSVIFQRFEFSKSWYLEKEIIDWWYVLKHVLSGDILLSFMIPISLYVSLQFVHLLQARTMEKDPKLSYEGQHMKVYSSYMNSDLAHINIIFSDKTGTLTDNIMKLRMVGLASKKNVVHDEQIHPGELQSLLSKRDLQNNAHETFLCMTLCHSVILNPRSNEYEGESPDECAMLSTCRDSAQYTMKNATESKIVLDIAGITEVEYEVLCKIDFNSDRKRMSIIVRHKNSGNISCYMKGADSHILPLLDKEQKGYHRALKIVNGHLTEFSTHGLRTLVMTYRKIASQAEFERWFKAYENADFSGNEREKNRLIQMIESDHILLGCVGIEDKLQFRVPQTIKFFRMAGIKIWMLTGDKLETAINIGYSSNLIAKKNKHKENVLIHRIETFDQIQDLFHIKTEIPFVLAFNGFVLDAILHFKNSRSYGKILKLLPNQYEGPQANLNDFKRFIKLLKHAESVICCRATPLQKSRLVRIAKTYLKANALAIGDGANDVSMIQEANIGVGIKGREGSQATRASDYALGRFHMLRRLLAVHGTYSYQRGALFVQYSIYKSFVVTVLQILFCTANGFSGSTIIDSWVLGFYNLLFTSVQPLLLGVFERHVDEKLLYVNPKLYSALTHENVFNFVTCIYWLLSATYHGVIIYIFLIYGLADSHINDYSSIMVACAFAIVWVVCIKAIIECRSVTFINHVVTWASIFFLYVFYCIYSAFPLFLGSAEGYQIFYHTFQNLKFHLVIFGAVITALIPDIVAKVFFTEIFINTTTSHQREFERATRRRRSSYPVPPKLDNHSSHPSPADSLSASSVGSEENDLASSLGSTRSRANSILHSFGNIFRSRQPPDSKDDEQEIVEFIKMIYKDEENVEEIVCDIQDAL